MLKDSRNNGRSARPTATQPFHNNIFPGEKNVLCLGDLRLIKYCGLSSVTGIYEKSKRKVRT